MFKSLRLLFVFVVIGFLPACADLGISTPQSFEQQIAYGYSTVASIRSTAADLLVAKRISVNDAKVVQSMADQARASLDIARVASTNSKPKDAQESLLLAQGVLTQLQTYLTSKRTQ
jgi:hypothetical protein